MLDSVFIANRGEIAARIARTCDALGIRVTVSTGDYLDPAAQVAQALAAGARAVHPGYGFLSEDPAFARAVTASGLVWVGPSAQVMERMARKDAAREIAVAAGVPVVATGTGASYPVLVKAAAGGGGKGMRVVRSASELAEATAAAQREALSAFGDDAILVETYVEHGRHVEVQIIADTHGTVLHLLERDCSTQRRHQKVIEEAPAPTLDAATRERLQQAAVDLATHVGYTNAGTVEFLLDSGPSGTADAFYFLEMNTRLQVEHPVTEAVARVHGDPIDLVELQLRVAGGDPLGFTQADVTVEGHAIEARVYAEDSFGAFLPQAGTASIVRWPSGDRIRVDHALEPGQAVSTSYDPMLGKVIACGRDRESARLALVEALDRTAILGLTTNAGFLRTLLASGDFRDATIDTAWLDTAVLAAPDDELPRWFAAWVSAMLAAAVGAGQPFQSDGFRLGAAPAPSVVRLDREVVVDRAAGTVDGTSFHLLGADDHVLDAVVAGERIQMVVNVQSDIIEASHLGQRFVFTPPDRLADSVAVTDGTLSAPMPGTVLAVGVAVGDPVTEGEVLGVLEAMKMELALRAPFAGVVSDVAAVVGVQVPLGATLFVVEPAPLTQ